jgi:hypothetical protein
MVPFGRCRPNAARAAVADAASRPAVTNMVATPATLAKVIRLPSAATATRADTRRRHPRPTSAVQPASTVIARPAAETGNAIGRSASCTSTRTNAVPGQASATMAAARLDRGTRRPVETWRSVSPVIPVIPERACDGGRRATVVAPVSRRVSLARQPPPHARRPHPAPQERPSGARVCQ